MFTGTKGFDGFIATSAAAGQLARSRAKDEVVVGASVAGVCGCSVILGVRVCVRAGFLEGLSAGGGGEAWTVGVGAEIATVLVWRLAEGLQIGDGAGGSAALVALGRVVLDVDGLNGGGQVVRVLQSSQLASDSLRRS